MISKQPLARRIVIAFVLLTLAVSGTFSLSIVAIVHFVEERLVSEELADELNGVLKQDVERGLPPRLDIDTRFFAADMPQYAVPEQFAAVPRGFSEVIDGEEAYYVLKKNVEGHEYMLVQDQQGFEQRENILFRVVFAGFLLSVIAAWALGRLVARRVMAPVIRLAQQARHRDQLHLLAPALAPEYPDDEVGRLAAAFDSTLGQLRHSLDREQLFTSDVSHELRTPLMVIATSCELLMEFNSLDAKSREQILKISRAAEEMRDLVQTFLMLARAKSDESSIGGATLAAIAEEQSKRWALPMQEKGLKFNLIEREIDPARYKLTLVRAIMSNLLRNALHYTESGSVDLIIEAGAFRVEDTGEGIPLEHRERMFQSFVRGERARGEGLGLGLSLVKRICEHEGWQVSVEDMPHGGSSFRVILRRL
jgi:signal transduction histidine kinase